MEFNMFVYRAPLVEILRNHHWRWVGDIVKNGLFLHGKKALACKSVLLY